MATFLVSDSISFIDSAISFPVTVTTNSSAVGDLIFLTDGISVSYGSNLSQRGNIDYDQIRRSARAGDGSKFHMLKGSFTPGHTVVFDADGNLIDAGH